MSCVEKRYVCIQLIESVHVESVGMVGAVYIRIGFKLSGVQFKLKNRRK